MRCSNFKYSTQLSFIVFVFVYEFVFVFALVFSYQVGYCCALSASSQLLESVSGLFIFCDCILSNLSRFLFFFLIFFFCNCILSAICAWVVPSKDQKKQMIWIKRSMLMKSFRSRSFHHLQFEGWNFSPFFQSCHPPLLFWYVATFAWTC